MKLALAGAAMALASVAVAPARAVVIEYTLDGGDGTTISLFGSGSATVTITDDPFSIDLTPGVAEEHFFLGGSVSVQLGSSGGGTGTIAPTLTITSSSTGTLPLSQSISITRHPAADPIPETTDVIVSQGNTIAFDLGAYTLHVTPLAESRIGQEGFTTSFSNSAEFLLTPIPEPAGLALLACGGLLLARRRARG